MILYPKEGETGDFGHFPWVLAHGFWRHLRFRDKNPEILYEWVGDEPCKPPRWSGGVSGALVGFYGPRKKKQAISAIFRGC